ncbi:MAG: ABC transporter permease, partial [Actinomycetales bacterium]|nr:ABC transporter permease [Actinomycetales bacterium]
MILKLIGKRLGMGVLTLLAAALITFFLVHLQKGSPGVIIGGMGATKDKIWQIDEQIGWHQPLWQQFFNWLVNILQGNLGNSYIDGRNLSDEIITRISVTATLALGAVVVLSILGVLVGVIAAVRGGIVDRILNSSSAFIFALPPYWLAVLLVLVFAVFNPWLPATGYIMFADDPVGWAQSLILPVMALAIPSAAGLARSTRAAMLEAY